MSLSIFPSHFYWHCVVGAHNRKREIVSLWGNVRIRFPVCSTFPSWVWGDKKEKRKKKDDKCKSRWRRVIRLEPRRKVLGWGEADLGGERERKEKKKWWYLLFHPPLYSSRHGNMPGGHSREASSLAKTTERQGVSESNPQPKRDRQCARIRGERGEEEEEEGNGPAAGSSPFVLPLREGWVWLSGFCLRSVMNAHSSPEVSEINVGIGPLRFYQPWARLRVWISPISLWKKRTLIWDMKLAELIKPRLMPNIWN